MYQTKQCNEKCKYFGVQNTELLCTHPTILYQADLCVEFEPKKIKKLIGIEGVLSPEVMKIINIINEITDEVNELTDKIKYVTEQLKN